MGLGTTELIIIFAIILLIFGAGKIPKVARDLGSGIKEFKKSISGEIDEEDNKNEAKRESKSESSGDKKEV